MSNQSNMKPDEARSIIFEVYGERGQVKAAAELERGQVTISRWCTGVTPVRAMEALLLRMILLLHRKGLNWRKWMSEYQEEVEPPPSVEDVI